MSKRVLVRTAQDLLEEQEKEISISKLSVMTGLQRPDVNRLLDQVPINSSRDFISKIIGQWSTDKSYLNKQKHPRPLSTEGINSEFAKLVRKINKDLNPHTIRFELERLKLIRQEGSLAHLISESYISTGDPEQTLQFASEDARDLLQAGSSNAFLENALPHLHARTTYDNIPDESLEIIEKWFLEIGTEIHARSRAFLSQFDRDISPSDKKGTGRNRVVIGTFSFHEPTRLSNTQKHKRNKE